MKKVLCFIGAILYALLWSVLLLLLAHWITPWFMSQELWFFIPFWIILSWPILFVMGYITSFLFGIPMLYIAKSKHAKIQPTIILLTAGFWACAFPWMLKVDYNAAVIFKALVMDCIFTFVFFNTIKMLWEDLNQPDND